MDVWLACGRSRKETARRRGIAKTTVDTHLKHADLIWGLPIEPSKRRSVALVPAAPVNPLRPVAMPAATAELLDGVPEEEKEDGPPEWGARLSEEAVERLYGRVMTPRPVRRYIITSAQNATEVHAPFLRSLESCAAFKNAELIVIPYRYRNPTSIWTEKNRDSEWWSSDVQQYLLDRRVEISPNLVILGDIKTQPTAVSPLTGFETISGSSSAIIAHPRLELATIPTPQSKLPKILTTTGSCTVRNYTPSKAGKKGEHHHTFGACMVEVSGDRFHLRQINALDDGSFIDLEHEFDGDRVRPAGRAAGLVMGDSHQWFIDPGVVGATFDRVDSIVAALRPKEIVWHDPLDFYSRNHHHRGKIFTNLAKHRFGKNSVETELDDLASFIDQRTLPGVVNVFPRSNHPDAIARWIEETDPRTDEVNGAFWARTYLAMNEGVRWTPGGAATVDPFSHWMQLKLKTVGQAIFLGRDQPYRIVDIEVGYHGDHGPNGARGNRKGFTKIGTKTVIGHSHSPGICGGVYQVGTSTLLRLEYTSGPSSWLHTHCVIYRNGKRSLINIIGGDWRA
jgi:hypothetical protein